MIPEHVLGLALGINAFVLPLAATHAQTAPIQQPAGKTSQKPQAATHKPEQFHSEGERIFVENCSRCHTAPDGFSPRISGTVVRHMRVRAQLSGHDERELLRFLNP